MQSGTVPRRKKESIRGSDIQHTLAKGRKESHPETADADDGDVKFTFAQEGTT